MKEAYVSYETAKLLKEKGFDWDCNAIYGKKGEFQRNTDRAFNNGGLHVTSAPTHQMACAWLREVHNMHIDIDPSEGDWHPCVIELETWSAISDGNLKIYDSYEEAVEAGLKYSLENLI